MNYPQPNDASLIVSDWLSGVDDAFECHNPHVDLQTLLDHVLTIALDSSSAEIRCEAIRVLRNGLLNHSNLRISLRPLALRLPNLTGEELLLAINAIGVSCDSSLADYIKPFLAHEKVEIRTEASECLAELR